MAQFRTAWIGSLLLLAASATQAQISNGSFELPATPTFTAVAAGQNTIPSWVVGLVGVDVVNINNGIVNGAAFLGNQYLDLDGSPGPGRITQAFATNLGQQYSLSFAYANNFVAQATASATVRVFDGTGDILGPTTFSHSTSASGNLDWTVFSGTFTAAQAITSIEFSSLSAGGNGGIFLDGIAVTAVPEPSGLILAATGTMAAAALRFRRRIRAATHG